MATEDAKILLAVDNQPKKTDVSSDDSLSQNGLDIEEKDLFSKIPMDGESIGNKSLRQELGWDEEKYWKVRNRLVDKNYIQTGMDRGGSVFRVKKITEMQTVPISAGVPAPTYDAESDLYNPVMDCLEKWSKEVNLSNYFIEKTANQGSRKTGGMWTRPDIVIINVESFQYVPNRYLELMTFEVKPSDAWEISSVFETAAHSRFASRSYLAGVS